MLIFYALFLLNRYEPFRLLTLLKSILFKGVEASSAGYLDAYVIFIFAPCCAYVIGHKMVLSLMG